MEAKVNGCGSARGDVRWVVRVGHVENNTWAKTWSES